VRGPFEVHEQPLRAAAVDRRVWQREPVDVPKMELRACAVVPLTRLGDKRLAGVDPDGPPPGRHQPGESADVLPGAAASVEEHHSGPRLEKFEGAFLPRPDRVDVPDVPKVRGVLSRRVGSIDVGEAAELWRARHGANLTARGAWPDRASNGGPRTSSAG